MNRPHHRRRNGAGKSATLTPTPPSDRDDLRTAIAHAAARLIAEGLDDYHAAKLKAARQLGVDTRQRRQSLPDNQAIEAALREHHALFDAEGQAEALHALRETALHAMEWLRDYDPWLTGAVLSGTANGHSAIELELIGVEPKLFEMFLLNEDVEFDAHDSAPTHRAGRQAKPSSSSETMRYDITFDDAPLEITLFPSHAARMARHPHDSIRHDRAQFAEARKRFDDKK